MRQKWIFVLLGSLSVIGLILSSCGTQPGTDTGGTNASTPTPAAITTVSLKDVPTHTPVTPTPTTVTGTVVIGKITVTLNKNRYSSHEKITVTIVNGLSTGITTMDHQSACTILTLQAQAGGEWVMQVPCRLETATRMVTIPAKSSLVQSLQPGGGTFTNNKQWPKGQYRVVFSYMPGAPDTGSRGNPSAFTPVYSPTFVIG